MQTGPTVLPGMKAVAALIIIALIVFVGIPAGRTIELVELHLGSNIDPPKSLPVRDVSFSATDGVRLSGWYVPAPRSGPVIILVPGFKADRMTMLPYARMLHKRYQLLLYDPRGTGKSGGVFSFGAGEVRDVLGALHFVESTPGPDFYPVGLLGVSLGSGDVIVAAKRDRHVRAVVADSPYTDQTAVINALDLLHVGPVTIPLAPIAPILIDRLCHVHIESFSPLTAARHLAPRPILLIHARFDANSTTPLSAAQQLRRAARPRASLWVAPLGGHAQALAAQPKAYRRHVLEFFGKYL